MKVKIPFITFLFFIIVYANQGISGLPGQCIYYLTREHWGLSLSTIALIGLFGGIAWSVKPIFGILCDYFPIKHYRTKFYLWFNYITLILAYIYIIIFGLNIWSLAITSFIINMCLAFNDVCNDTQMVILEQKHNLNGRIQAIQWSSLGIAGLAVAFLGAKLADAFAIDTGYRIAYALTLILPILSLYYLAKYYKEDKIIEKKKLSDLKGVLKSVKNKSFLLPIVFIAFLQFCPSFGLALQAKCREELLVSKMFLGYLGMMGTGLGLLGYFLYYWKAYKFPIKKMLYFMVAFSAVTNIFYLYIPNKWFLVIYGLMFGAFGGITFLTLLSLFARIIPKGAEGLIYAFVTSVSNFCGRGSALVGGMIADNYGYNVTVIVSTALTLVCILFIPFLKINEENTNE